MLDPPSKPVVREYDQPAAAEMKRMQALPPAEMMQQIDELLLPVGPATGQLMNILIKEAKAKTILDIGTSHGYSKVWQAQADTAICGEGIRPHGRGRIQRFN